MTDREKLIDLIINAKRTDPETGSFTEYLGDFLLGYGVKLPDDRPVSREQVEKAWFREPYTRLETRSTPEGNRQYIAENTCMACGSKTPIGHFCHNCGVALDDWAVDMMLERWKEAVDDG